MDILSHRIKKVAESILENEGLISGLDQSSAELLQNWGIAHATKVAEKTAFLDDEQAEKVMYPQLRASRRFLRAIRVWLQYEANVTTAERKELWQKVEKRARDLYGEQLSLPAPEQFEADTPAVFVGGLRSWLEDFSDGNGNQEKQAGKRKNFFQKLFTRGT